jgi:hypothetical protein
MSEAPHTNPMAKIIKPLSHVVDARVLKCDHVTYRLAEFGGYFLLVGNKGVYHENSKRYAHVKLQWYGWQPKQTIGCRITLLSDHEIIEHYTGTVVSELGD